MSPEDYYTTIIRQRGEAVAAELFADECRQHKALRNKLVTEIDWFRDRAAQLDAEAAVLRTALELIYPSVSGAAYTAAQRGDEHAARIWGEHAKRILAALEVDAEGRGES